MCFNYSSELFQAVDVHVCPCTMCYVIEYIKFHNAVYVDIIKIITNLCAIFAKTIKFIE